MKGGFGAGSTACSAHSDTCENDKCDANICSQMEYRPLEHDSRNKPNTTKGMKIK